MIAQCDAFVVRTEEAALLQNGDDVFGESRKTGRQHIWHQVEAIGSAGLEPVLDIVRNLLGRADDRAVAG